MRRSFIYQARVNRRESIPWPGIPMPFADAPMRPSRPIISSSLGFSGAVASISGLSRIVSVVDRATIYATTPAQSSAVGTARITANEFIAM